MTTLSVDVGQSPPPESTAGWLSRWVLAARPKTLTAGLVPVLVGSGVASAHGHFQPLAALLALVGAMLIQIGTNLTNDYYDFVKGADTAERLGPTRATQSGLLPPSTVLRAAVGCFASAVAIGLALVWLGGWLVVAIGVCSIAAGYAYTGGPFPLAYHGLGDLFVLIFFGLVAVAGTYYVQALQLDLPALVAGVYVGASGTALIVVNNLRDRSTDAKASKRTLAVRFGERFAQVEYTVLVGLAHLLPLVELGAARAPRGVLLSLAALPLALGPLRSVWTDPPEKLNRTLAHTARWQLVYGLLLALGWLAWR